MTEDPHDMLREDVETFQRYRKRNSDTNLPAMVEFGFGTMTALVGLVWVVALFWVPDPIPGQAWLGIGMLGLVLFGLPAALIYILRRGGGEIVAAIVREQLR